MPDIVLIIPPNPFLEDEKRNCPLGILYVAASLENAGYEAQVIDLRGNIGWNTIPLCSTYGITSSSADYPYAKEVIDFLRDREPCRIILGGSHSIALNGSNDFSVVVGEGEIAILDLLKNNYHSIQRPFIQDMDSIPCPARYLLPKDNIVSTKLCHQGVPSTTIISSRGCPFNCSYCASPRLWGRQVRRHSPEYVIEEVKNLVKEYGVEELRFQDDELNLSKEWLQGITPISDMVHFRCNARAEIGNWQYLKEAGCYEVGIGLETTNPYAYKIHKGVELGRAYQGIWDAYNIGLDVRLFLIIGLPYDTGDISGRTIEFLERMPPVAGVHLNIFSPFLGSAIGDNPERFGVRVTEEPVSILLQNKEPHFTCQLEDIDIEELEYHYLKLREYIEEREWVLA